MESNFLILEINVKVFVFVALLFVYFDSWSFGKAALSVKDSKKKKSIVVNWCVFMKLKMCWFLPMDDRVQAGGV